VAGDKIEIRTTSAGIEVVDRALDTWLMRVEPGVAAVATGSPAGMVGRATMRGLVDAMPTFGDALKQLPDEGLKVVFSPAVRKGLQDGTYRLAAKGANQTATAINGAGHYVEHGVVAGTVGGVGAAALSAPVWPIALAVGVATAAAMAEQHWLEKTFGELRQSLARIETRLRDDDLGRLISVDRTIDLLGDDVLFNGIPEQMRTELAIARQDVDAIFWSRRRFVDRFAAELSDLQNRHEARTGKPDAWAGQRAVEIVEQAGEELVVFLASLITRGRVTALTSAVLAYDGDVSTSLRMLDGLTDSTRTGYFDLYNRVRALDRADPTEPKWKKLLGPLTDHGEAAAETVHHLSDLMTESIGDHLPEREQIITLPVASLAVA
jgi:hypothetical protein